MRRRRTAVADDHRIVHLIAGRVLEYPDEGLSQALPRWRAALQETPTPAAGLLEPLLDHLAVGTLSDLQGEYVETFDLSRKHALYLSYWTDGDTRRRGEVLGSFKAAYRRSGFLVDTHGELPDYLPMVLEFAAIADPRAGAELLQQYRASLELLRIALLERGSPYLAAAGAVCATLPGRSPQTRAEVMTMAGLDGPPGVEPVGLEPYGRPLLPVQAVSGAGR